MTFEEFYRALLTKQYATESEALREFTKAYPGWSEEEHDEHRANADALFTAIEAKYK